MGAVFIAYIFFGRSKQKLPTKLNLRANDSGEPVILQKTNDQLPEPKLSVLEPERQKSSSKQLSIFFMYNGHDWEAHEILGIPQGSGVDAATKAYQAQLKTADPSSYEFLESAYNAVFKKRRNERL